jgi:ATP-dependent helicase HrpA
MSLRDIEARISQAMQADQHRLRNLVRALKKDLPGDLQSPKHAQFDELLEKSLGAVCRRRDALPAVHLDPSLPITAKAPEIVQAVEARQVVVVCGETGSGKSTQLPKICLQAGRGLRGFIGHTQPRRIAARSIAARLGSELGGPPGGYVGFKVRFTDTVSRQTYVKLMTDGILLAETQRDRFLDQYDVIIVDEAHERSLNIDFLLGYLKRLLPKRRDLRLIITSATIDAARFAEHFSDGLGPAPVVQVSGRSYPVETRFRAPDGGEDDETVVEGITAALEELSREPPGDVLVFLPTERDIRDVARRLRGWSLARNRSFEILPLYARLSAAEQNRVFQVGGGLRIVLATNVAESSLTVPSIRYVIDSGTARISRYSPRSKVQRLPIESVSRASADQRQGRCGRVAPGVCIRLYSEDDYSARDAYSTPEIRRTNLAAVILRMLALRLGDVNQFPFLDAPRLEAVRDGYKTLFELGAIDQHRRLTDLGKIMSRLPVDPRIARMTLAGNDEGCLAEILIIATALEIQDPRERPVDKQQAADECHRRFLDERSDFVSYLNLWDFFHELKAKLSKNQLRKACRKNFLSFNRLREWQDLHRQLKQLVEQSGMKAKGRGAEYDLIHRALLTGILSNVALRMDRREYQAAGGMKSFLWPGSGLVGGRPQWVMAAEAIETSQRFLRTAGRIDPRWIEELGDHLVKRSYRDPYWSKKRGTVLAFESVTIFGLAVLAGRRTNYTAIDQVKSRQLFIEHGLVAKELRMKADFYERNCQLLEHLESLAAKSRRSSYLVGDGIQYAFYDERLPEGVCDVASLTRWLKRAPAADVELLVMSASDLVPEYSLDTDGEAAFPESIEAGPVSLAIDYRYQPGDDDDGLSVTVPLEAAGQIDTAGLEWGVPGLLEEKLLALIRSLPKPLRRCLVPAPDSAKQAAAEMSFGIGSFLPAVASVLSRLVGEPISIDAFDFEKVPRHLQVNVRVVDDSGIVVAEGRDLRQLRSELSVSDATRPSTIAESGWEKTGIIRWDFGDLPSEVTINRNGLEIRAFPMLVDDRDSVSLALSGDRSGANRSTRGGLTRLVCLAERRELKSQVSWLPKLTEMELFASTLPNGVDLRRQLTELLAHLAFVRGAAIPASGDDFDELLKAGRRNLPVVVQDVAKLMVPLWESYHGVCVQLEDIATREQWADTETDLRRQLNGLTAGAFLVNTPWDWLLHYPRFMCGIVLRIERLQQSGHARDVEAMGQLRPFVDDYEYRRELQAQRQFFDEELNLFGWMLEEFRISLFCQTLGTSIKVSPQRLEKQWSKVAP